MSRRSVVLVVVLVAAFLCVRGPSAASIVNVTAIATEQGDNHWYLPAEEARGVE